MTEPLKNARHERFCQEFAKTCNSTQAYINAGYSKNGAEPSSSRLLSNAKVRARVQELRGKIADGVVDMEIGRRSARMAAYQDRWQLLRELVAIRAEIWRSGGQVDSRLLREIRALEQQAAQDAGQWADAHRLVDAEGKDRAVTLDDLDRLRGSE